MSYSKDQVSGPQKSNHSGVDGGAFREPMLDLMQLLSSLTDPASGRVLVPGFYDQVREVSQEEVFFEKKKKKK